MSITQIAAKWKDTAKDMTEATVDVEIGLEEPLLSDIPTNQDKDINADELEEFQKRANSQIDAIARLFWSIALVAALGILFCVVAMFDYKSDGLLNLSGAEWCTYIVGVIVSSAVLALYVQRRIENSMTYVDDDCKECKKKMQEDSRRRLLALFLIFVALLFGLMMILGCFYGFRGSDEVEYGENVSNLPPFLRGDSYVYEYSWWDSGIQKREDQAFVRGYH